jgi:hypothetical protein
MSVECNKIRSPNENRKHRETKILKLDPVFLSKISNPKKSIMFCFLYATSQPFFFKIIIIGHLTIIHDYYFSKNKFNSLSFILLI